MSCQQPKKHSSKRAYTHATAGFSWYKGQLIVNPQPHDPPPPTVKVTNSPAMRPLKKAPRLSIFNWNAGGLSAASYDLLLHWLHAQAVDLAFVQETH